MRSLFYFPSGKRQIVLAFQLVCTIFAELKTRLIARDNGRDKGRQPLPAYATKQSAGLDLRADIDEDVILQPLQRQLIPTGLHIALPEGYEAQVRPRSGLALKHGVTVLNTPGTIDADYRGEIGVVLVNLSQDPFMVHPGERVARGPVGGGALRAGRPRER